MKNFCFGGEPYHISTSYNEQKNSFEFTEINEQSKTQIYNCSKLAISSPRHAFTQDIPQVGSTSYTRYRPCDQICVIPKFWATQLFEKLKNLQMSYKFGIIQERFIKFETCTCNGSFEECKNKENCTDNLRIINNIAKHYPHLCTLLRKIYMIRHDLHQIIDLNKTFYSGQFLNLTLSQQDDINEDMSNFDIGNLKKNYNKSIK